MASAMQTSRSRCMQTEFKWKVKKVWTDWRTDWHLSVTRAIPIKTFLAVLLSFKIHNNWGKCNSTSFYAGTMWYFTYSCFVLANVYMTNTILMKFLSCIYIAPMLLSYLERTCVYMKVRMSGKPLTFSEVLSNLNYLNCFRKTIS